MNKDPIKILIDTTCLFDQYSKRGISRYAQELLKRLLKEIVEERWKATLMGFHDLEANLVEIGLSQFAIEELAPFLEFYSLGKPVPSGLRNLTRWQTIDEAIFEVEPDIFFAPHFERGLPSTPGLKHTYTKVKTAVVVHDVIPLIFNSYSQHGFIANSIKKIFYNHMFEGVRNADVIFTSSNKSKEDLQKVGQVDPERIKRVYLGVDESFWIENQKYTDSEINEVLTRFNVAPKTYFFYDSGLEANKGIADLVEVLTLYFSKLKKDEKVRKFVMVGNDFYKGQGNSIKAKSEKGREFLRKVKKAGILPNIFTTGRIDDDELKILLRHSAMYLYFSQYEGFGFGPIQAMASKIPSVVNNASCLPEIVQDGAEVVDVTNHKKTFKALKEILQSDEKIEALVKQGRKVAKQYNWQDTTEKTWEVLKELAQKK